MKKNRLNSNKGQLLIEAVLLLTLLMGLWSLFSRYARDHKWFDSLVSGPWQTMSGMIESGTWQEPQKARKTHPNNFNRVIGLRE